MTDNRTLSLLVASVILLGTIGGYLLLSSCGLSFLGSSRCDASTGFEESDAYDQRGDLLRKRDGLLEGALGADDCDRPVCRSEDAAASLDIYVLVDRTGSFEDDMQNMRTAITEISRELTGGDERISGRIGLGAFGDKVFEGEQRQGAGFRRLPDTKLSAEKIYDNNVYKHITQITGDLSAIDSGLVGLTATSAFTVDSHENPLEAMLEVLAAPERVGFRSDVPGVLIVVTDARYKEGKAPSGSGLLDGEDSIIYLPAEDGVADRDWRNEDFPHSAHVDALIKKTGITVIFLISGGQASWYRGEIDAGKFSNAFLRTLSSDSRDLGEVLNGAIEFLCPDGRTPGDLRAPPSAPA